MNKHYSLKVLYSNSSNQIHTKWWSIALLCVLNVLIFQSSVYSQTCNCTDYILLNDTSLDEVHKFPVDPVTGMPIGPGVIYTSEVGFPHGGGMDLNGNVYMSDNILNKVVQLDCNGNILNDNFIPNNSFANGITIENTLFTAGGTHATVAAYDLCTGTQIGTDLCLNSPVGLWSIDYSANGTLYAAGPNGGGGNDTDPLIRIPNFSVQTLIDGTCFDPTLTRLDMLANTSVLTASDIYVLGVTENEAGNEYYVVLTEFASGITCIQVYDNNDNFVREMCDVIDQDGGFFRGGGIEYFEGKLYLTSYSEDCVAVVDAMTGTYLGGIPGAGGKTLWMTRECCPDFTDLAINDNFCVETSGQKATLPSFLPCNVICVGEWTAIGTTDGVYDSCDNSFTYSSDEEACFKYDYVPNPANPNATCEEFHMDICITFTCEPVEAPCEDPNCLGISTTRNN